MRNGMKPCIQTAVKIRFIRRNTKCGASENHCFCSPRRAAPDRREPSPAGLFSGIASFRPNRRTGSPSTSAASFGFHRIFAIFARFYRKGPDGGIGRHAGLKIPWAAMSVRVRFPLRVLCRIAKLLVAVWQFSFREIFVRPFSVPGIHRAVA